MRELSYYEFDPTKVPQQGESLEMYIRRTCKELGISLDKLSRDAGMPRTTLYGLFDEQGTPKVPHLLKLAKAMKVHHYYLFRLKWPEFDMMDPQKTPINADAERLNNGDACAFIDETVPDGTLIMAGAEFEKSWTIQNVGNQIWENRYYMHLDAPYYRGILYDGQYPDDKFLSEYRFLPHETLIPLPTMKPGDTFTLKVPYTAPQISGRYISYWRMVDDEGHWCFPRAVGLWASILVWSFGVAI